jgi:hypothetical protein
MRRISTSAVASLISTQGVRLAPPLEVKSGSEQLRKQVRQAGCYAFLTFQKTGDTNCTTSLTDFRKTVG